MTFTGDGKIWTVTDNDGYALTKEILLNDGYRLERTDPIMRQRFWQRRAVEVGHRRIYTRHLAQVEVRGTDKACGHAMQLNFLKASTGWKTFGLLGARG